VLTLRVSPFLALRIGLLIPLLLLVGCAGLGKTLDPPRINLSNVQFQESKALETVLQIELRVFNTNDIPIKVKGLDCDLELNGKSFAKGVSNVDKEIPAFGTTTVPVTLYEKHNVNAPLFIAGMKRYPLKGKDNGIIYTHGY
jgi:LEA14-like dessication related protein